MKNLVLLVTLVFSLVSFKGNDILENSSIFTSTYEVNGDDLEDEVEAALKKAGISYVRGRKFGPNGSIGEIDFEVSNAIIEVTKKSGKKLKQIKNYISNKTMNPTGKTVILFAPNYGFTAGKDIEEAGALVVREMDDLIDLVD